MSSSSNRISRPACESNYYTASEFREVLRQHGFAFFYVKGVSMRPLIWEGSHYLAAAPIGGQSKADDAAAPIGAQQKADDAAAPIGAQQKADDAAAPLVARPKVGDILAFEQIRNEKTAYIVHRLIDVETIDGVDIYVMRGDNCITCERIREEDIIGVVTDVYRNGGWRPWHAVPQKHFSMNGRWYRFYKWLWLHTWPLRRVAFGVRRLLSKVKHRLIGH